MAYTLREVWRSFKRSVASGSAQQDFLKDAADMDSDRLREYERAQDYYEGDHRVQLTTREKEYLQASGLPFAENFCETIVDAKAGALRVRGFSSDDDKFATFARDLWRDNRMESVQKRIHEGAVKLGDYFLIIEPNEDGLPLLCPNRPQQVKVIYDSDESLYAVKKWTTARASASNPSGERITRLNVYWPDSIEKFYSRSADEDTWAPFRQRDEDEGNAAFWTMDGQPNGEPIGIPVIHFANKPDPYYGRSKLRGVIPQQDALNKTCIDFFWVMDAQGWPQQWGTGVTAEGMERHPGSLWTTEQAEARFGQMDPADPEKSISAIESQIKRMASRSNTPLHLMLAGGNLPSGETLKTSESGFTREGEDFQVETGGKWQEAVRVADRIDVAFGDNDRTEPYDASLRTEWKGIESRNEVDEANVAVLKQTLGVSTDTLLKELGYDPEAEREKREAAGEGAAQQLLERAAQMAPTRSEELGGGEQPAQNPRNRVTR